MNQPEMEKDAGIVIEDIGMSEDVRAMVIKEKLPDELGVAMESMKAGQSIFIKTGNVPKKLNALRSKYYRWRQKNEDNPHRFSLIKEEDGDGNTGIRMYKHIPTGD